ncbi:hypothetical protein ACHAXH_004838 [Discostella pseudostelligera]
MDWILDWQERLERRVVEGGDSHQIPSSSSSGASAAYSAVIRTPHQQSSFVCGMTYSDVEARCKRATSSSSSSSSLPSASSSSIEEDYHGVHYCPTGSSTECPSSMECYYATVSCSLPSSQQLGVAQGADLELLPGLPPLVSPSSNILSRLDVDSLTMALLNNNNNTNSMANSNANITEIHEENEEEEFQVHWKFGSICSWGTFFRESFSSLMAPSSSSTSASSSHSSLRYSSRQDWN